MSRCLVKEIASICVRVIMQSEIPNFCWNLLHAMLVNRGKRRNTKLRLAFSNALLRLSHWLEVASLLIVSYILSAPETNQMNKEHGWGHQTSLNAAVKNRKVRYTLWHGEICVAHSRLEESKEIFRRTEQGRDKVPVLKNDAVLFPSPMNGSLEIRDCEENSRFPIFECPRN